LHELRRAEFRSARFGLKEETMTRISQSLAAAALLVLCASSALANETMTGLPAPVLDNESLQASETAVLAGGCFWGMQGVFQYVKGVRQVLAGYAGGNRNEAQYEMVGTGMTGNAESVQIVFDPKLVSYGQILRVYFSVMDPTTLNYQGPDEGTQYRSEIFYANGAQQRIAAAYIAQLTRAHTFAAPIVTQLGALNGFARAEAYHQDYLILHPNQPYIVINDQPKVATLKRLYPQIYATQPVRVSQDGG
jgi:peptide-methionine (S)-S-oxide reductase